MESHRGESAADLEYGWVRCHGEMKTLGADYVRKSISDWGMMVLPEARAA